ncbi:glycosyltransferase family 15 protein [Tricholoma matsutake]|nr:glycosyltransferase family 15 protein [Tricholoma matsutake 945]
MTSISSATCPVSPVQEPPQQRRTNATIVMLVRNSELEGALDSVRQLEDRFNRKHGYPYVFLNDVAFTENFKTRMTNIIANSSEVAFGVVPKEHWEQPEWIDEAKATNERNKLALAGVKYGDSIPYRNMCRFNSGFFFKHELLQKYRWYWRVEPKVRYHCDILTDPFLFMEENNKVYSFVLTVYEISSTIFSLWRHVRDFIKKHPEFVAPHNSMEFISDSQGLTYNLCHYWSNFEIADMDFWRGPAYTAFFDYLDATGGFYYERWGDAPVHSIAASLFASKDQVHFFEEIGYQHDDWSHCPLTKEKWEKGRCSCDRDRSFDYNVDSCKAKWDRFM